MTQLLISVRSAVEARVACQAGADLIDVKEPARGALGAADRATIEAVVREVDGRLPVSVALGELPHAASLHESFAGRVRYAKFGLAGCGMLSDWRERWEAAVEALPERVSPVAVVYADWRSAGAPQPRQVVAHAKRLNCGAVLLDTFDKSRGPLLTHFDLRQLRRFIARVRGGGFTSVVAGSLRLADVAAIAALECDYIGVRGAACAGDRTGALDGQLVFQLASAVHQRASMHERLSPLATTPARGSLRR
jgi:uncharacterized protein (UPF0264 family)